MSDAAVAAVIVSYRTGPVLFESLARALEDAAIGRVVLVDNGNPAEAEKRIGALAADNPRLSVLRGQGNVGFARACNMGAARARAIGATHLLFLNPDACLEPGAVAALCAAEANAAAPWIAGARIFDRAGREQRGGRRATPTLGAAFAAVLGRDRIHLEKEPEPAGPVSVGAVSGAAVMMATDQFFALGGFDEAYFLHAEDLDLCRRALEAGGEVIFVPQARVTHAGGTSAASPLFVQWCKGRGLARYFVKFAQNRSGRLAAIALGPLIVAAAVARGLIPRRAGSRGDDGR